MTKDTDNQIHLIIDTDFYNIPNLAYLDGLIYDVKGLGVLRLRELNPDFVVLVSPTSNDSKTLTSMKIPHVFLELPSEALHDVEYLYKRLSEIDLTKFRTKPRSSEDTSTPIPKRPPALYEEELRSMRSERVVNIPDGVEVIENCDFAHTGNEKIYLPDGVTTIGNRAFYSCKNLASIEISNSVISIGEYAFWGCINLESIVIPNNVVSIGDCAFSNCKKLKSIEIPDSVTHIGDGAFAHCESLKTITIPDDVTVIEVGVFYDCINLESAKLPNGITSIGMDAFYNCRSLASIVIPNSVTHVGDGVFYGCENLKEIQYLGKTYTVLYKNNVLLEANTKKPIAEFLRECIVAKGNTEVTESVEKLPKRIRVSEEELLKMIKA